MTARFSKEEAALADRLIEAMKPILRGVPGGSAVVAIAGAAVGISSGAASAEHRAEVLAALHRLIVEMTEAVLTPGFYEDVARQVAEREAEREAERSTKQ